MTWHGMHSERVKKQIGILLPQIFGELSKGRTLNAYMSQSQVEVFSKRSSFALLNSKELLSDIKQNTKRIAKEMQETAIKNIDKINNMSNKEISDLLKEIKKLQSSAVSYNVIIVFADVFGQITDLATNIITKRKNLKNPSHIYSKMLSMPFEKSLTESAYENIKGINASEELLEKYFWLEQGYIGRGLTLEQLNEIRKSHEDDIEEVSRFEEVVKELELSEEEKYVFEVSRTLIELKSLRADSRQFLHVLTNKIIDLLAKRLEIDVKSLEALYTEEICEILESNKTLPKNIEQRKVRCLLIPKEKRNGYDISLGEDVESFLEQNLLKQEAKTQKELKGQTAYAGKVKGKVKLVFGPQHNDKVKEGDILVSIVTSPQLLPAMKRAKAFVTDIGGVTCHAAIVSREMKKPCIVGTKTATQVLHDGDLVEVDADKGVVRIIKK
ncbi:hypothetical protein GOV14_05530 [Candidatus Pacearchaeota archaeon]|nr:hypothetical protein [Candidatus Pacearchaeota archaeon]